MRGKPDRSCGRDTRCNASSSPFCQIPTSSQTPASPPSATPLSHLWPSPCPSCWERMNPPHSGKCFATSTSTACGPGANPKPGAPRMAAGGGGGGWPSRTCKSAQKELRHCLVASRRSPRAPTAHTLPRDGSAGTPRKMGPRHEGSTRPAGAPVEAGSQPFNFPLCKMAAETLST